MKKIISTLLLGLLIFPLFALPGFKPYLPDGAGEYVFYRDYTFERESYVGILAYDDTQFQVKYYAPRDDANYEPELSIALLFSVNPDATFFDMTGELIMSTIRKDTDDLDILNYLHDILYDFSSRRIKQESVVARNIETKTEYEQFGGNVTMVFDCTVPLFNVKRIVQADGKVLFDCVCTGKLSDSNDPSFDDFKGMPHKEFPIPQKKYKSRAKAKKFTTIDNQVITLDKSWEQVMENCFTCGNDAVITINTVPQLPGDEGFNKLYLLRRLMQSSALSYADFSTAEVIESRDGTIKIVSTNYQAESQDYIKNIKILTKDGSSYNYFALSAFEPNYTNKRNYFDKLVKNYK